MVVLIGGKGGNSVQRLWIPTGVDGEFETWLSTHLAKVGNYRFDIWFLSVQNTQAHWRAWLVPTGKVSRSFPILLKGFLETLQKGNK